MSAPSPKLHPLFQPDILESVHQLRLEHERQLQHVEDPIYASAEEEGGFAPDPVVQALDRLCVMLMAVREENLATRKLFERLVEIIAGEAE